jgi:succinate dehydrogenase hydrophobic anchor subunit
MASIGLAASSLGLASAWQGWVIRQGTNQLIQPGWWAFRYGAVLLLALVLAVAGLVTVKLRPPTNRRARLAIEVVAGLEILLFGVVWFSLVIMPFPA